MSYSWFYAISEYFFFINILSHSFKYAFLILKIISLEHEVKTLEFAHNYFFENKLHKKGKTLPTNLEFVFFINKQQKKNICVCKKFREIHLKTTHTSL